MCGIAGYYGRDATRRAQWMASLVAHRGPDDEGVWTSLRFPMALANRRLKILDLSSGGRQPMTSRDGRWTLTFNGEIYNYVELRADLGREGHSFRSDCDTEVLLAAWVEWGASALLKLRGMFAFALWDDAEGALMLGRDRLGIKPLYYANQRGEFAFGSELKAILGSGIVEPKVDSDALEAYLRLLWVPESQCMFCGIKKVPPGHFLRWDRTQVSVQQYWDLPEPSAPRTTNHAVRLVRGALEAGMRRQLRSDVPVGAFLSGGIDSTTILALAIRAASGKIRSYSIGFARSDRAREGALDDVRYARLVASRFGVPHEEITLEPDVVSLLPKVVLHLEEPIADPAAINCYLICEAARATSTVLLSGTGGDELFGGYRKYSSVLMAEQYQRIPVSLRRHVLEPVARRIPVSIAGIGLRHLRFLGKFAQYASEPLFERFIGYSTYYGADELEELLGGDPSRTSDPYKGVRSLERAWQRRDTGVIDRMTYVDLKLYLPGLGLSYMDKASMAASVEVRVPLLDDDVVELVAGLPDEYKVQGFQRKIILRQAVCDVVPREVLRRPKAPFSAPVRSWLQRDLTAMLSECLSPGRIIARGLLNPAVVGRLLREHKRGYRDHSLRLWALLTLEVWFQEFFDNRSRFAMQPGRLGAIPQESALHSVA